MQKSDLNIAWFNNNVCNKTSNMKLTSLIRSPNNLKIRSADVDPSWVH